MANLTDEQREDYRRLYNRRKYLLQWLKKYKEDPDKNLSGEVEEKRKELTEIRKKIRELKPASEKQLEARKKWFTALRKGAEKAKQRNKEKQKEPKSFAIKTDAPQKSEKGKKVIKDIIKKTADEHKKELRAATKKPEVKESEVKKPEKVKKDNVWVWIVVIMGIVGLLIGAYLLVKKYTKEIKNEQPGGSRGSSEPQEDDGFWWQREGPGG